jgi:N-acetylmuramoyl-L-alanine amidase
MLATVPGVIGLTQRALRTAVAALSALLAGLVAHAGASLAPGRDAPVRHAATNVLHAPVPAATVPIVPAAAASSRPSAGLLAGKVVGIDPGHNGHNYADPGFINHLIWNGREQEGCDTTGTETDGGYTETQFNWNVASYLKADLGAEGAKVVLTRISNTGVGPCVTTRAQILNHARANVAIDIHADGGPAGGRGFTILEPVADGPNNRMIGGSLAFARILRARFLTVTGMPESTYDGVAGLIQRDDLAGLNLATEPKVLIETGNMRNATDAALLVTASFQRRAATAMAQAITEFLVHRH